VMMGHHPRLVVIGLQSDDESLRSDVGGSSAAGGWPGREGEGPHRGLWWVGGGRGGEGGDDDHTHFFVCFYRTRHFIFPVHS